MKKMKFVTKGLALLLMGVMLAGCGNSVQGDQSESTIEEKSGEVQESTADADAKESSEKITDASDEESADASTEESNDASTDASTEESSEERANSDPTEESGQKTSDDSSVASTGDVTGYEEYFKNFSMDGKKISMELDENLTGVSVRVKMEVGAKDGNSYLYFAVPSQKAGKDNYMTMYFMKDKSAYLECYMEGEEPVRQKTKNMDEETANSMNLANSFTGFMNEDGKISLKYVKEDTIDGVAYDVLKIEGEDETEIYMNKKTKEWEILKAKADGEEVMAYILPVDDIKVPSNLTSAEEVTTEDFTMTLGFGMVGLLSGAKE